MSYGMNGWNKRTEKHARDCISRAEAIDFFLAKGMITAAVYVERMPPTRPEQNHGRWLRKGEMNIYGGFKVECSVCHGSVMITNIEYEHYCRNCGARMDEEEVSE